MLHELHQDRQRKSKRRWPLYTRRHRQRLDPQDDPGRNVWSLENKLFDFLAAEGGYARAGDVDLQRASEGAPLPVWPNTSGQRNCVLVSLRQAPHRVEDGPERGIWGASFARRVRTESPDTSGCSTTAREALRYCDWLASTCYGQDAHCPGVTSEEHGRRICKGGGVRGELW